MSLTRTLTSVGAITIGLAVSGCGGGSDVLTRAEYASQANAICAPAIEAMDAEIIPVVTDMAHDIGEDDADPVRLQDLYAALIEPAAAARETASDMLRELRDLNAPSDIRDDVVGLWTDIETMLDMSLTRITEAAADPAAALVLWEIDESFFVELDQRARDLGLPDCTVDT